MSAFGDAVEEVSERCNAIADLDPDADVTVVHGKPSELVRRMLSGYVDLDDTEEACAFLAEYGEVTMRAAWQAAGPESAKAGMQFAAAQLIAVGVALARREAAV